MPETMSVLARNFSLDRLAIGLSGLCVIHCVASAVLLALITSGGALLHPAIHEIGLALAILLGALALGRGVMSRGIRLPVVIGILGLGVMAIAMLMPHDGSEIALTIIGAAILAFGHELNRRAAG